MMLSSSLKDAISRLSAAYTGPSGTTARCFCKIIKGDPLLPPPDGSVASPTAGADDTGVARWLRVLLDEAHSLESPLLTRCADEALTSIVRDVSEVGEADVSLLSAPSPHVLGDARPAALMLCTAAAAAAAGELTVLRSVTHPCVANR